jgi:hypothetical protein
MFRATDARAFLLIFAVALEVQAGVAFLHPPADMGDRREYRMIARSIAFGTGSLDAIEGKHEVPPASRIAGSETT